jgi:hypothetical protein
MSYARRVRSRRHDGSGGVFGANSDPLGYTVQSLEVTVCRRREHENARNLSGTRIYVRLWVYSILQIGCNVWEAVRTLTSAVSRWNNRNVAGGGHHDSPISAQSFTVETWHMYIGPISYDRSEWAWLVRERNQNQQCFHRAASVR